MGAHWNIAHDKFPNQSDQVGLPAEVCFQYDLQNRVAGVIVRDDQEAPYRTIIQIEGDKYVLAEECSYSLYPG